MIIKVFTQIKIACNNYEQLFIDNPDGERDLGILIREAEYIDEKLKIIVYNGAIICYKCMFYYGKLEDKDEICFDLAYSNNKHLKIINDDLLVEDIVLGSYHYWNDELTKEKIIELGNFFKERYNKKVVYSYTDD